MNVLLFNPKDAAMDAYAQNWIVLDMLLGKLVFSHLTLFAGVIIGPLSIVSSPGELL